MQIDPATAADSAAIEALLDHNFGSDRHKRTAYRLREGASPLVGPTLVMRDGAELVGSVQVWPIDLAGMDGSVTPLTLLGPIVVDAARHGQGIGSQLMRASLAAADAMGCPPMLLIGDPGYYGRFGFSAATTGGWNMPGPFEPHRLLLRAPAGVALPRAGMLLPVRRRPARLAA